MTALKDRVGLHTWTLDTTPLPAVLRIARESGYNAVDLGHANFVRCMEASLATTTIAAFRSCSS